MDFNNAYDSVRRDVLSNILIEFGIPVKIGITYFIAKKTRVESVYVNICLMYFLFKMNWN